MTNAYDTEAEPPEQQQPEQPPVSENFLEKNGDAPRPDSSPPPQQVADLGATPDPERDRWLARTRAPTPPAAPPTAPVARPPVRPPNFGPPQGQPPPPWPPVFSPNRRQWYFSPPARGPGMWGMPRRFPMLPPLWQIPMLFSQIGMGFGQFGSGMVSPLGFGLNRYTLAFMNGMQKGQLQYSKQMREQMEMQADQLEQQAQVELDDYNRAFREFGDPDNPDAIKPENIPKLKQRLYDIANKYNDQHMKSALDNNDIQGAVDQIKYLDQKHGDLKAAKAAKGKGRAPTKEEGEEAAWEGKPTPGSEHPAESAHWPRSPDEPLRRPAAAPSEGAEPAPGALASPEEEELAHMRFRGVAGEEALKGVPGPALARTAKRAAQLEQGFHKAVATGSTPEERLDNIRKVDPSLATELDALTHYRGKIPYARQGVEPRIVSMAQDVDPKFNPDLMSYIRDVRKPGGKENTQLTYSQSLAESQQQVFAAAKKLMETHRKGMSDSPIWNSVQEWIDTGMKGDSEWSELFAALNNYSEAIVRVSRGATGAEADVQRALQRAKQTSSIKQILGSIKINSADVYAQISAYKESWDTVTEGKAGPLPGYSESTAARFKAVRGLDEQNFTFPKDAPEDMRNLEPGGTGLAEDPEINERRKKFREEGEKAPAERINKLSPEDRSAYDWAKAHADDPRAKKFSSNWDSDGRRL